MCRTVSLHKVRLLIQVNLVRMSQVFAPCLVGLRRNLASTSTSTLKEIINQAQGLVNGLLVDLFILFILIGSVRYILNADRRQDEPFYIKLIIFLMIGLSILAIIITAGVVGVVFVTISRVGGFVNSDAAAIAAVATTIYTLLTCWLIMETRRARRVQEAVVRVQEAAIKAQEAAARSDGEATARIATSLERTAQALERQHEATRLDARPPSVPVPANGGSSHDGKPSAKITAILHRYMGETVRRGRGNEGEAARGSGNGKRNG